MKIWTRIIKCKRCGRSIGYCVSNGCEPKTANKIKIEIDSRAWLGFEEVE